MDLRSVKTPRERRLLLEKILKINLAEIGKDYSDEEKASSRNCENMIGSIQVPLGIAGPLKINGENAKGEFYLPLATTEGALIASVNRGCKVIKESGGAVALTEKVGTTRSVVFKVDSLLKGKQFIKWTEENFNNLKKISESTSGHLSLLSVKPWLLGKNVFLRFSFDCQEAMGMNMVTIALSKTIEFIKDKTGIPCVSLSANMCVDKKPSFLNFIEGRGIKVWAEIAISDKTVKNILKTTSADILEVFQKKILYGSMLAGSLGFNAHFANVLSGIFLATGQDMAHVAECAMGSTIVEKVDGGIHFSVYLPDLMIGTVGGGTNLVSQKEALSILGLSGGNDGKNVLKLAELIGAAVLAGEISLLASLSNNTLACAHERLGRGQK